MQTACRRQRLTFHLSCFLFSQVFLLGPVLLCCPSSGLMAEELQQESGKEDSAKILTQLLSHSLDAYGGAEAVQAQIAGITAVGRELDATGGSGDTIDAMVAKDLPLKDNFRLSRKGNLWRLDHENSGLSWSQGFDGNLPWVKSGGSVQDLQGDSALSLNFETMSPALVLLEVTKGFASGALDVKLKSQKDKHVVEVQSSNGDSFILNIEPNSYQVTSLEVKGVKLSYSQYKPALGSVFPFRQTRSVSGRPALVRVFDDVSLKNKFALDEFDRPGGTVKLSRTVHLPFDYSQRELLVKGRLNNGEELEFLFDTGASETIIDRRVAAENLLLKEGESNLAALGGAVATNTTTIVRLELGNLVVNDLDARILDLSGQSRHLGRRLAGIIGTNLISRYVVAIDYGKEQISFYDADDFVRPNDLTVVPFTKRTAPVVKVRVGGKEEVQMLVDTGAAYNNLPAAVAQRYGAAAGQRFTEGTGLDGRNIKLGRVTIDSIALGGKTVPAVDFTYTLGAQTAAANSQGFFQTNNLGIIGNPLLENFVVYIDYKFQRMLLKSSSVVKVRSEIDGAIKKGDDLLIQKREFKSAEVYYQKALLSATANGDKRNEAKVLGRIGNLKRMMAKDLGRPEHAKAAYDNFTRAQALAKRIGAGDIEGRILADWSLLYLDTGALDSARQTMDRALLLAPQDAAVNVDCSVHLFKAQRYPEMQRYIEKALFLEPSNWQALWYQVKLAETFVDYQKAISTLKEILHYYPWARTAQEKLSQVETEMARVKTEGPNDPFKEYNNFQRKLLNSQKPASGSVPAKVGTTNPPVKNNGTNSNTNTNIRTGSPLLWRRNGGR